MERLGIEQTANRMLVLGRMPIQDIRVETLQLAQDRSQSCSSLWQIERLTGWQNRESFGRKALYELGQSRRNLHFLLHLMGWDPYTAQ